MRVSDATLWERWREQRDPDAFAEIVSRHSAMVYASCRRILGNASDAEDVAQDCFLELLNRRVTVRFSLAPWLHTVATRRALNKAKLRTRRRHRERRFMAERAQSSETVLDDLLEHVDAAIADLPERSRAAIVCHFLEGQPYEDIARHFGVSESAIRYRTAKGIERIRAFLRRRGIPISTTALATVLAGNLADAAPLSLTAVLGKLSIAGSTAPVVAKSSGMAAAGASLKTIGGMLIMKKLVVAALVTVGLFVAVLTATQIAWRRPPSEERADVARPQSDTAAVVLESAGDEKPATGEAQPPEEILTAETPGEVGLAADGIRIAGRVLDLAGQPVAGARVLAQAREFGYKEAESSAGGVFEIYANLISNDLTLQAEKGAYESAVLGPMKLRGEGVEGLVLELNVPRTGSIAGNIVDGSGNPMPGLFVNAHRTAGLFARQTKPALTDSNGGFKLDGLAPAEYVLVASFFRRNPEALMTVRLARGQTLTGLRAVFDVGDLTIAGRVVDTAGEPIDGADVFIHNGFGGAIADENGDFLIKGLSDGVFMVDAYHEDHSWVHVPNVAAGTENLVVVMLGKARVAGRVVRGDNGEPLTEFDVFHARQAEDIGPFQNRQRVSDPDGRFVLERLDAGDTTVTARAEGFAPASQRLSLKEHETFDGLEFRLEAGRHVEGLVVDARGTPVTDAYIYAGPRAGWPENEAYVAQSDSQGRFIVSCLSTVTEPISAYHPDFAPSVADIGSATHARIVLQKPGTIEGVVLRGDAPVPGMAVAVIYQGERTPPSHAKTKGDGTYKIEGLAPGTATVFANIVRLRDGGALQKRAVVEPGRVTRVDFNFRPRSAQVGGRITIAGKAPLRAKVGAFSPGVPGVAPSETLATSEGYYTLEDVSVGEVVLTVEANASDGRELLRGITLEIAEGDVVQQDVNFAASDKGQITGRIFGRREDALPPHVFVFDDSVSLPEESDVLALIHSTVYAYSAGQCSDDGTFSIAGLPAGRYTVLALELLKMGGLPEARLAIAEATVADDEPTTVDFDFRE